MKNIKTIFILVLSLILFAVSCSNEDKTGSENNTPEDTEIKGDSGSGGSETETTVTIDAKDFPTDLLGTYKDDKVAASPGYVANFDTKVSTINLGIQKTQIEGNWLKDGVTPADTYRAGAFIEKWKQTKKGGNPIKLEGEYVKGEEKYTIIYDYASGTLSGTYAHSDGTKASFNGKKIS